MGLKARQLEKASAYKLILNGTKACISCVYAKPNPIAECALFVVCMYRPFKRYESWIDLPYLFGHSRGRRHCNSRRNYRGELGNCTKYIQRQNPLLFLRKVLWIKRLVWHLLEHKCLKCPKDTFFGNNSCRYSHTIHAIHCQVKVKQ